MNKKLALLFALGISCPLIATADNQLVKNQDQSARARMGNVKDQAEFNKMVDEASAVYSAVAKGAHGEVPVSVLNNARCIAVLPNVVTGAIIVGGTHGEGLASCKDSNNVWSQPAAISLNQGSIGLQAGAKSTDLVLFFQSKEAEKALKRGEFKFGTEISAVAGTYDSKVDTSSAAVVAYTRTEGLFAGAAVNGGTIGNDASELETYYGRKVNYEALLEGREKPDTAGYTSKFTKLLPI